MAKKRRKKAKVPARVYGRKKSFLGSIDTTNIMGVAAGAVGAKFVDRVIPETVDAKIVAGGKVVLGVLLPMLSKDGKTKAMLNSVGSGMVAIGTVELLTSLGVLSGVGANDSDMLVVSLDGVDDIPVVNGADDIPVVNGDEDVLAGGETVLAGDDDDDDLSL